MRLGRLKTRPSELIRQLRKSGMTYRQISKIAGVSSGSVSAELRALKKEIAEGKTPALVPVKPENKIDLNSLKPQEEQKIELEITRW